MAWRPGHFGKRQRNSVRLYLFKTFTWSCDFTHETISPGNCQAFVQREQLWKLPSNQNSGLKTSQAQRPLGRPTKSMMPTAEAKLRRGYIYPLREAIAAMKVNRRALTATPGRRDLEILHEGDTVRMQPIRTGQREWRHARVKRTVTTRAFEVEADADAIGGIADI